MLGISDTWCLVGLVAVRSGTGYGSQWRKYVSIFYVILGVCDGMGQCVVQSRGVVITNYNV